MTLPSGEQWSIRHGDQEAVVVQVGGGIRSYTVGGRPVLHGYAEDAKADAGRGQLLMPWPNRVRDGKFSFEGRDEQLALSEPSRFNASHGLVRWSLWSLVEQSENALTVAYSLLPQQGWDWRLDLRVRYELDDDGLTVTPSATNVGTTVAPFGFGAHPYLTAGEETVDELTLSLPGSTVLDVDERLIPTGRSGVPRDLDFREARAIGATQLDHAFTDLEAEPLVSIRPSASAPGLLDQREGALDRREGVLDRREGLLDQREGALDQREGALDRRVWLVSVSRGEVSTTLWGDASAYPFVQVFTGDSLPRDKARRTGVAVEPMTCPANALATGDSLVRIEPGDTWSAPWGVRPSRVPS
ncbi:aldose 1-epimerase family protein [Luteipulveratus halotolerans]|uniref:Galactose mutarotase n=1 Tax=Luteipulveratus halotolerans TaxID=1631356 RepID=A0A0L6CEG7_9MICO|nr:aldose 1-epimerase family protein [Luteipulveratus halotolerans]KNX36271.1 galactose mutarotase [Luteipulveratus halotolerans]